jgi:hypothetical protein
MVTLHRLRRRRRALAKGFLEPGSPAAQQRELAALRQQRVDAAQHQVQALLLGEPAHHDEQRRVGPVGQPQLMLQHRLAARLAAMWRPSGV